MAAFNKFNIFCEDLFAVAGGAAQLVKDLPAQAQVEESGGGGRTTWRPIPDLKAVQKPAAVALRSDGGAFSVRGGDAVMSKGYDPALVALLLAA